MSTAAKTILDRALALPAIDRASIAEKLLIGLDEPDPEIDKIWAEECERRIAALEAGKMKTIPEEEVREELDRMGESSSLKLQGRSF